MRNVFLIVSSILAVLLFTDCTSCSETKGSAKYTESYDGTYYWSDFQVSHTVVISGDRWTGTTIMYGERSYDYGTVKGRYLYDSSGYFDIARISGNTIDWGNHTLRKE